jgi:hypothetical protein
VYNTFPPTNGLHYDFWLPWGLYHSPVNQLQTVHNLEHGGIVIQWGDEVADEDVAALWNFYGGDRNAMLLAPLHELDGQIALEAWTAPPRDERAPEEFGEGRLALCPRFDEDAFTAFRDTYRYRGPESWKIERALLEPGL